MSPIQRRKLWLGSFRDLLKVRGRVGTEPKVMALSLEFFLLPQTMSHEVLGFHGRVKEVRGDEGARVQPPPWYFLPSQLSLGLSALLPKGGGGDNHYSTSPAFSLRIPPLAHFLQQPKKPPQQHLFTLLMNMHLAGS